MVFDSSAVLAVILGEPGAEMVAPLLPRGTVSTVNVAEIMIKMADKGASVADTRAQLEWIGVLGHAFDEAQAHAAGALRGMTRRHGLSLADMACLALAKTLAVPALTADRAWLGLDLGVEVRLIR